MDGGARLRVTVLGGFRVARGAAVLAVPGVRLQGLLVRLALAGGRAVEPDVLIDGIWAEEPPPGSGPALQTLVSRLRRALGPDDSARGVVVRMLDGYRLAVDAADVDALRFERLAAAGRERLRAGDPEAARAALAEAVALWGERPGALPAVVAAVAPTVAGRLAQVSIEVVTNLAEAELSLGRVEVATAQLTGLLDERPVDERAAALLMDAYAAAGREAQALTVYEGVRESLIDTLGADPGSALRERHLRLLRSASPGDGNGGTVEPGRVRQGRLPAPLTSFVGRDDELTRIGVLLTSGRLVTVLGPGGAGKTRLALEAARRHQDDYRDGAWLVDLASVTEPAKVAATVLAAIGRRGPAMLDARRQAEDDEPAVLAAELGGRETLLLVDNCEHLIDAVAHLVAGLLARCPGLRVLATSREPLAVDGEALVPLGPLALPDPDDGVEQVRRSASVRLFAERAAAVRPGFAVDENTRPDIVRVVRGLDGLPLALELAAARLRTLSLPELAGGLADRFRLLTTGSRTASPRHRTLRAVIAWSWGLLGEHERTVAERISVLPGGVTPASAVAVCAGTAVPAAEIPGLIGELVERSLLQLGPASGRYRMLETIREYGVERLTGVGDLGSARDLAAAHFTELIAQFDPQLRGSGQLTAMTVIGAEYDNTLAALRHLCARRDDRGAIALALSLTWYWQMFGRQSDGVHWLGEALAIAGRATPERDCARVVHLLNRSPGVATEPDADDRGEMRDLADRLLGHRELPGHHRVFGPVLLFLLDPEAARANFQSLADGDDVWLSGLAHLFLAEIAGSASALTRTGVHVEGALARFRQAGDRWGEAAVRPMRARLRRYDDLDGALSDLHETRRLAGEFGALSLGDQLYSDLRWIDLHIRRDETDRALAMIESARTRARRASSTEMLIMIDAQEAALRVRLGHLDRATGLLDDAERAMHGDTDVAPHPARTPAGCARAMLCLARSDLRGVDTALRDAYAAALTTREPPALSPVAVAAAALAAKHGHHPESAELLGVAARLRGAHDRTDPAVRDLTREGQAAVGTDEFTARYTKGWDLDLQSAVIAADPGRGSRSA